MVPKIRLGPGMTSLPTSANPFGGNMRGGRSYKFAPRHLLVLLLFPLLYLLLRSPRPPSNHTPFLYPPSPPSQNTTFSPTVDRQIPPYLHYIFGLSEDYGGKPFGFIQYLCLSSALGILKPEVILFHHLYEPKGWYWEQWKLRIEESGTTRLEMVKSRDVKSIRGNEIEHFAHKADVIRLEALRDWGGIYLDTDVVVVRDFAPLYKHATVMGMESQPDLNPSNPPSGLCNAVILAKPYSSFILRWLDSYKTFDKNLWATHSVTKPWALAREYPFEITVLNKFAFFWPLWHEDHLRLIHRSTTYSFTSPPSLALSSFPQSVQPSDTQFTYHLWESLAWSNYLSDYTPDTIHNLGVRKGGEGDGRGDENSFSRLARRWVGEKFRREWREANSRGDVE